MDKKTIPVLVCGYCGTNKIARTDKRCPYCDSLFDWEGATDDPAAITPMPGVVEENGTPLSKTSPAWKTEVIGSIIIPDATPGFTRPSLPRDYNTKAVDAFKRSIGFEEQRRKILNVHDVIFVGMGTPRKTNWDHLKRRYPDFANRFQVQRDSYHAPVFWIFANGKDGDVKMSWVWSRTENGLDNFKDMLFKIVEVDIDQHERDGKTVYNIARRFSKVRRAVLQHEKNEIASKIHQDKKKTVEQVISEEVVRGENDWCFVECTCLDSKTFSSGTRFARVFDDSMLSPENTLNVFVSPELAKSFDEIKPGDEIIVTGYRYKPRKLSESDPDRPIQVSATAISLVESSNVDHGDVDDFS